VIRSLFYTNGQVYAFSLPSKPPLLKMETLTMEFPPMFYFFPARAAKKKVNVFFTGLSSRFVTMARY
jgi:hypothetical protein